MVERSQPSSVRRSWFLSTGSRAVERRVLILQPSCQLRPSERVVIALAYCGWHDPPAQLAAGSVCPSASSTRMSTAVEGLADRGPDLLKA